MVVSEHSALLQLIQVSQDSSEGGTAGIFTDKDLGAQEGTRWAWGPVTGRWPTWSLRHGALTARPLFSVFCPLLLQPPLRLRAKRSCFSSNSSGPSVNYFLQCFVFFFFSFLISCRFLRTFQEYKNRIEWKGNTMCHSRVGLSGRKIVVS